MEIKINSVLFILKILFILPLKVVVYCFHVWYNYSRRITLSFVRRILMREAFLLGDICINNDVINPVFEAINSLFLDDYEYTSKTFSEKDISILGERFKIIPSYLKDNLIKTRFNWYYKPQGFDPTVDQIMIFSHGGGFAIKLVPMSLIFLNNISRQYTRMAIIIHDYTVTNPDDVETKHPIQLLETVVLYDKITEELGCRDVLLVGESAGGNIILSTLQYLYRSNRPLPNKILTISPWCNPTYYSDEEQYSFPINEKMDSLSFEGLFRFTNILLPDNYDFKNDTLLDIERNFDADIWRHIVQRVNILITYGTDEILQHQIKKFVSKLEMLNEKNFNIESNVHVDKDGAHIDPILSLTTNLNVWSKQDSMIKILRFIEN